jgi:hypothetical protein
MATHNLNESPVWDEMQINDILVSELFVSDGWQAERIDKVCRRLGCRCIVSEITIKGNRIAKLVEPKDIIKPGDDANFISRTNKLRFILPGAETSEGLKTWSTGRKIYLKHGAFDLFSRQVYWEFMYCETKEENL